MLLEVLYFGKAAVQGSWCAPSTAFMGCSAWGSEWGSPCLITMILLGTKCCGKRSCYLGGIVGAHRHLRVGRRGQSKSWDHGAHCFRLWWVVLSFISPNRRSKQPGICALWGFPGMFWVVWGRAQRYEMQSWYLQSSHGDRLGYTKYVGHLRPLTHHSWSLAFTLWISNVQTVLTGHQPNLS